MVTFEFYLYTHSRSIRTMKCTESVSELRTSERDTFLAVLYLAAIKLSSLLCVSGTQQKPCWSVYPCDVTGVKSMHVKTRALGGLAARKPRHCPVLFVVKNRNLDLRKYELSWWRSSIHKRKDIQHSAYTDVFPWQAFLSLRKSWRRSTSMFAASVREFNN